MTQNASTRITEKTMQEISDYLDEHQCPIVEAMGVYNIPMCVKTFRIKLHRWRKKQGLPYYTWRQEKPRETKPTPEALPTLPKPYCEPRFGWFEDCQRAIADGGRGML